MVTAIGALFIVVPSPILVGFVTVVVFQRRVLKRTTQVPPGWLSVPGQVTSESAGYINHGPAMDTGLAYARRPTVFFRAEGGGQYAFESPVYGTYLPRPGTRVQVVYDPSQPQRARIGPSSMPRGIRILFGAAAVVIGVIAIPLCAIMILVGIAIVRAS